MDIRPLEQIARRQQGRITASQAASEGFGRSAWRTLCHNGILIVEHPGVARLAGAPTTPLARITSAWLAGSGAYPASHTTAALLWAADVPGDHPVHLMATDRARKLHLDGVILHRPRDRVDLRGVPRLGITVTDPFRTLCDVGAVAPDAVDAVLHTFLASGLVRPGGVVGALARHAGRGRAGIGPLRRAVADLPSRGTPPDSLLETQMARLLADHALPPATFHALVGGIEVDFRIEGSPVVIECDGWTTHGADRHQFELDRERDAALQALGFIVCRFTWRQITMRPSWVAGHLRAVLREHAPHLLGAA